MAPKTFIRVCDDVEGRSKDPGGEGVFGVLGVDFRACEHACHGEHRIKASGGEFFGDDRVIGDVFVFAPHGGQQAIDQRAEIAGRALREGLLRGDHSIGGGGDICWPEGRGKIHLDPTSGGHAFEFLHAVDLAPFGAVSGARGPEAVKEGEQVNGFIGDRGAMFGGDFFETAIGQIGEGRQQRKIIVDMRHLAPPDGNGMFARR